MGEVGGEMPVLGNSKVMGQVRAEHSVLGQWEKREKGRPAHWVVVGDSMAAVCRPGVCPLLHPPQLL